MAQAHTTDSLRYLADRRTLTPMTLFALRFVVLVAKWEEQRRTRLHLAQLDDHLLDDIGLTRFQADQESSRRFWD